MLDNLGFSKQGPGTHSDDSGPWEVTGMETMCNY